MWDCVAPIPTRCSITLLPSRCHLSLAPTLPPITHALLSPLPSPAHGEDKDHWKLVVYDVRRNLLYVVDSCPGDGNREAAMMRALLADAGVTGTGIPKLLALPNPPRQKNPFDCGLFVCAGLSLLAAGVWPPTAELLPQTAIPTFRKRMVATFATHGESDLNRGSKVHIPWAR